MKDQENNSGSIDLGENPVRLMQQWIDDFIIKEGLCPPLSLLAAQARDESGALDWNRMQEKLHFVSFYDQEIDDALSQNFIDAYMNFITGSENPDAPYTTLFLLPFFDSNQGMDIFMNDCSLAAEDEILSRPRLTRFILDLYMKLSGIETSSKQAERIRSMRGGKLRMTISDLLIRQFRFIPFYGQRITNEDLLTFDRGRGDVSRQKVLSRAPLYMIQVINPVTGGTLAPKLNTAKLRKHNNEYASTVQGYERKMWELRNRL